MLKILTGLNYNYDLARLVAINHETYVISCNGTYQSDNTTKYCFQYPVQNKVSGIWGLLVDTDSQYYGFLPEIHKSRLSDVVAGDGWNDPLVE